MMDDINYLLADQCDMHLNYGSGQDDQNSEIDWFNYTAWDDEDEECVQTLEAQIDAQGQESADIRARNQAIQPVYRPSDRNFDMEYDRRKYGKKLTRQHGAGSSVKRRRGPNKNQKILTEEERRLKKEKALCRNAESARTCRGKRKQAEERLKSKCASMEREFQKLHQTRDELARELCDLWEQARNKMNPRLTEAVDRAAEGFSLWMTNSNHVQGVFQDTVTVTSLPQFHVDLLPLLTQTRSSS